jgi:hypothetical protein
MSLTHCPLCLALAVLSTASGLLHALQLWQLVAVGLGGAVPQRRSRGLRLSLSSS